MKESIKRLPALFTALVSVFYCLGAQTPDLKGYYQKPLSVEPLTLSGSMGEFRATHFHTGYDFRVGGVSGAPVYAVADGYISRISVSAVGYGYALQVTHPNGTVSLYGHLDAFSREVAAYVEEVQYSRESFSVALDCSPEMFPVRKGQQIGKAGNTGDSAGPHLHFEIRYRDTLSGDSTVSANLLNHGIYTVEDTMMPEFRVVQFYGFTTVENGLSQTRLLAGFPGNRDRVAVNVPDTFFVAVDAIDRMNNTWSRMGIETWEFFLDDTLVYRYSNTDLPLEHTRYILSLIHYPERATKGRSLLKTWVEPGNVMRDRMYAPSQGLFSLPDTMDHTLTVIVQDAAGNSARRRYSVKKRIGLEVLAEGGDNPVETVPGPVLREEYQQYFRWDQENRFAARDILITVPEKALYRDMLFCATRINEAEWNLHTSEVPLHLPLQVSLAIPAAIPDSLFDKVVVLRQSDNGRDPHMQEADPRLWRYAGGTRRDSMVTFGTNAFGRFMIDTDTIPPAVSASFSRGADLRGRHNIHFTIKDACSGISSYSVTIDGKWMLGVHDGKRSRVTCVLDPERIRRGTKHQVVVNVVDHKNNTTEYKTEFIW
ncbi:MAG: M23 family metallopeptidase [Bacteroidales bacterium]